MTSPRVPGPNPTIQVDIERLVLDGPRLAPAELWRFQAAFEEEVARLWATVPAEAWTGGALARVDTAVVRLTANGSPTAWGRQIAGAIFGGLAGQAASIRRSEPSR